jgi:hypothetical protein
MYRDSPESHGICHSERSFFGRRNLLVLAAEMAPANSRFLALLGMTKLQPSASAAYSAVKPFRV